MRRIFLGLVLLTACSAPEPTRPAPPAAATPPTAPPSPPAPAPPIAAPPTSAPPPAAPLPPLAGHRDIHPLGGDTALGCVEMYSACTPDPKGGQRCTSASYNLDCGQTGQVPGGDRLRCVCP